MGALRPDFDSVFELGGYEQRFHDEIYSARISAEWVVRLMSVSCKVGEAADS